MSPEVLSIIVNICHSCLTNTFILILGPFLSFAKYIIGKLIQFSYQNQ